MISARISIPATPAISNPSRHRIVSRFTLCINDMIDAVRNIKTTAECRGTDSFQTLLSVCTSSCIMCVFVRVCVCCVLGVCVCSRGSEAKGDDLIDSPSQRKDTKRLSRSKIFHDLLEPFLA